MKLSEVAILIDVRKKPYFTGKIIEKLNKKLLELKTWLFWHFFTFLHFNKNKKSFL